MTSPARSLGSLPSLGSVAAPPRRVVELDPRTDPRWDAFVRSREDATVFHLSAWAEVLERSYGHHPRYLALEGPSGLDGVLPLMLTRGILKGRRLRSLPVVNAAGPLATNDAALAQLLKAACDATGAEAAKSLLVRSRRGGLEQLDPRLTAIPKHPVWLAEVPPPGEVDLKLWKKHSRNLYRSVNKALAAGLTFREAEGREDLRAWYDLYLATMRKRRTLPRSWRQLETARRLLEPTGEFRLFVVEQGGRMLAGVVTHPFGHTVELLYNGSDPAALELRPNHLLNWGVLGWASVEGYRYLDIGDAREGGQLARFKAQFKAEPVPDHRYDYIPGAPMAAAATAATAKPRLERVTRDLEDANADGLAVKAWERAPLAATRAAAALVYRFV